MPDNIENIVVIGGGLMGSSAAWQLSKYGEDVLLIEQQDSVYTNGSSYGNARITRSLGSEKDIFSYLHRNSVTEAEKLIRFLNENDGSEHHKMDDIYRTSPVTYIRYKSQENQINHFLVDPTDDLHMDEAENYEFAPNYVKAHELFGMIVSDSALVIRENKQYSGTMNPQVLISKLQQAIKLSENKVLYNSKVTSLKRFDNLFEIQLTIQKTGEKKTFFGKKVVLAAGPYNGAMAKYVAPYFDQLIQTKRLFLSFLKIKSDVYNNLSVHQKKRIREFYPVIDLNSDGFYSMIEAYDDDDIPIIKVGGHYLRSDISDLDTVWKKELTSQEIEWSKVNTWSFLKKLDLPVEVSDLEFFKGYSCVYSLTESEIPYVTNVIMNGIDLDPNFAFIGGMSGVGAKGALTYGLIAADLLLDKKDTSEMYQITIEAIGSNRLLTDIRLMGH